MTIGWLGEQIAMPPEGIACAQQFLPFAKETDAFLRLLEKDEKAFLEKVESSEHANQLALALFMLYAAQQWPKWKEMGLSKQIYIDTMRDLTLWYFECMRQTGKPGVLDWGWLLLALKGRVLRLGRLQYEPWKTKECITAGGKSFLGGTNVLKVHIPADGKLTPVLVQDSLLQACEFFQGGNFVLFHCHSWLLSPKLDELLTADSNILQFRNLFEIYEEDFSYRQAEERVFGYIGEDVEQYPETNQLQRKLKQYLRQGGCIGMGKGIIPFPITAM